MNLRSHEAGFTLIELLTVIVIIAILAALLFPVLSAAREKGNTARCLSNIRQWSTALTEYLSEKGGVFPEEGALGDQIEVANTSAWFNVLAPYLGEVSLYDRATQFRKQPRPRDNSIYTCPSATEKEKLDFEQAKGVLDEYNDPYMCYSYNLWIDHSDRRGENRGPLQGTTGFGKLLRISQVLKPAKFVVFSEVRGDVGNCVSYYLAYRHPRATVNIGFADGHAATYSSNTICSTLSGLDAKSDNKGGIIWNPEGNPPQTDPSF